MSIIAGSLEYYQRELARNTEHLTSEFPPRRQYAETMVARANRAIELMNAGKSGEAWNYFMGRNHV